MGITSSRRNLAASDGSSQTPNDTLAEQDGLSATGFDPALQGSHQCWPIVHSGTFPGWKYGAVLWGFDPRVDYTSNVKARLNPWCTNGRYFSVKYHHHFQQSSLQHGGQLSQCLPLPTCRGPIGLVPPMISSSFTSASSSAAVLERPRHFTLTITDGCFKQESPVRLPFSYQTRLHVEPEPAGHYLKPIQVVGYRDGIAILQVNCDDRCMEFVVVHLKTSTILGVHKEELISAKHYLCDCTISPDLSSFVLKPNAMYVLNFCRFEARDVLRWVSCRRDTCPVIANLFEGSALRPFVAFDPRYKNRRLAIGNFSRNGKDVICLYDLQCQAVIVESDPSHYQTTHNITFSPDGHYLASLVLGRSIKDGLFNFPRVLVYRTSDLSVSHVIRTTCLAEVPTLTPATLFPLFSETGTHLAVAYGEQGTFYQQVAGVHVYKAPVVLDLQYLCRLTIRERFDSAEVERLPLPTRIKQYLRFQPLIA